MSPNFLQYTILFTIIIIIILITTQKRNKKFLFNLPIIGALPQLLLHLPTFHDALTEHLRHKNGTVFVKQALLYPTNILITSDPTNVHFISTSHFSKFIKGPEWRKRLSIFGQHNVFNADNHEWKLRRNTFRAFFTHQRFQSLLNETIGDIIEKKLVEFLETNCLVDLQEVFGRLLLDFGCVIAIGSNPSPNRVSLLGFALDDAWEAIFMRYIVPERFWWLLRVLRVGKESRVQEGCKVVDDFCSEIISKKRQEIDKIGDEGDEFSVLNCYLTRDPICGEENDEVIRDMIINTIFATRDTMSITLSWFFYLVCSNPSVETKLKEEIRKQKERDLNKLVYLHAALCETLRLYPPGGYESRTPLEHMKLPSGHFVDENTMVLIVVYAMGRMGTVWGEDCCEFKPERWIMENGEVKHEAAYKFFAFNAGPRTCLGKDVAFEVMKVVVWIVMRDYDVELVKNHPVSPKLSVMFRMKYGLLARVSRRSI